MVSVWFCVFCIVIIFLIKILLLGLVCWWIWCLWILFVICCCVMFIWVCIMLFIIRWLIIRWLIRWLLWIWINVWIVYNRFVKNWYCCIFYLRRLFVFLFVKMKMVNGVVVSYICRCCVWCNSMVGKIICYWKMMWLFLSRRNIFRCWICCWWVWWKFSGRWCFLVVKFCREWC